MSDDLSPDVLADDDIADEPLFPQTPVTAEAQPSEEAKPAADNAEEKGAEAEETPDKEENEADTEAKGTEASQQTPEATDEQNKADVAKAARAFQERQRTRQAVEQKVDEVYAPKSEQELVDDNIAQGMEEQQAQQLARLQAFEERANFRERRAEIAELNANLNTDALNAANDFPIYNEKSPAYDKDFAEMVGNAYATAARIQTDDNGIILNAELPFYDFYKRMAEVYNRGASKGATQAQVDAVETLSRVEAVSGSSSTTNRHAETLEEMGERLADLPLI